MSNEYHGRYLTPPGGWTLGPAEEPPASIPARPYADETNSQPGRNLEQLGVEPNPLVRNRPPEPVVDFSKPGFGLVSIEEARSWGIEPPPAVVLADQLARLGARLDDADFTAAADSVRPELAAAIRAAAEESAIEVIATTAPPRAEPVTLDDIVEMMNRISLDTCPMTERIKLTREQMDALPKAWPPRYTNGMIVNLFDVPVELVETVEESTPYQWQHAQPGPLRFDRDLSDDELAELRRRFEEACTDTRLRVVVDPPVISRRTIVEKRPSIVGRIWHVLRRWGR
ncbi:hypothetical protein SD37_11620 [Amycolatopsis orientalis]|uniref:Uncharacterized protein n=1 Tax=Amycolatopsis orientalis TaxID=31958 RepID=A0A193BVG9_AMYOR|nr:hypothetical protein [Amycolatopsis orientalis]ANN16226.1 hypothetical protein SD37_11620 [Amycolatopsis orientalis]